MICPWGLSFVSQKLGPEPQGQIIKSKFDFMNSPLAETAPKQRRNPKHKLISNLGTNFSSPAVQKKDTEDNGKHKRRRDTHTHVNKYTCTHTRATNTNTYTHALAHTELLT